MKKKLKETKREKIFGINIIWIILISFSMIFHNVTLMPSLEGHIIRVAFAIVTVGIFVIMLYVMFNYDNLMEELEEGD